MAPTTKKSDGITIGSVFLYEGAPAKRGDPIPTETAHVVGETPRKWIIEGRGLYGGEWSVPKSGGDVREARNTRGWTKPVFTTADALKAWRAAENERLWAARHRGNIAERVRYVDDPAVVRQIAAIVGYVASEVA